MTHETAFALRVGDSFWRKHLDGDEPIQVRIPGLVNDAHAACAELRFNAVMAECLTDHWKGKPLAVYLRPLFAELSNP